MSDNSRKVEIFKETTDEALKKSIQDWLDKNSDMSIVSASHSVAISEWTHCYTACIIYFNPVTKIVVD